MQSRRENAMLGLTRPVLLVIFAAATMLTFTWASGRASGC